MTEITSQIANFQFRNLHPKVFLGTASDRYTGWISQIYSEGRYDDRITRRTKKVGGKSFIEEVLPVESVTEYFEHFPTLELDFTFYRLLLDQDGKPTHNFHVLQTYRQHMNQVDQVILKVPQVIFARKLRRGKEFIENETYLDPEIFTRQFYEPAIEIMYPCLAGFIFEQEYHRKKERLFPIENADALDAFFEAIPKDSRYHVEIRTESLLATPLFEVYEKYGIGQVLSHWTWLPSIGRQFQKGGQRFLNRGKHCIVRLLTPRFMRYADSYAGAHPFNTLVKGMLDEEMIEETYWIIRSAIDQGARISVIVNNRVGGNAPLIAQRVAGRFVAEDGG